MGYTTRPRCLARHSTLKDQQDRLEVGAASQVAQGNSSKCLDTRGGGGRGRVGVADTNGGREARSVRRASATGHRLLLPPRRSTLYIYNIIPRDSMQKKKKDILMVINGQKFLWWSKWMVYKKGEILRKIWLAIRTTIHAELLRPRRSLVCRWRRLGQRLSRGCDNNGSAFIARNAIYHDDMNSILSLFIDTSIAFVKAEYKEVHREYIHLGNLHCGPIAIFFCFFDLYQPLYYL